MQTRLDELRSWMGPLRRSLGADLPRSQVTYPSTLSRPRFSMLRAAGYAAR